MGLVYAKSSLDQRELQVLEGEMRARGKNLTTAYLLWFFLGIFFAHRFYLNRSGGVFLLASIVSLALCIVLIGFLFLMILSFIWLADGFRMSGFAEEYNSGLEGRIITEILASRAGGSGMPYGGPGPAFQQQAAVPAYAPAYAPPAPVYSNRPTVAAEAGSATGRLVVAEHGKSAAYNLALGQSLVVGRGGDAGVQLSDPRASRRHLMVSVTPSGWQLRDLGSTNRARLVDPSGTTRDLNGEASVSAGQVLIGDALLTLFPLARA
jgi:TM2 domain-containing membrane protein YozV